MRRMSEDARQLLVAAQTACRHRGGQEITVDDLRTALSSTPSPDADGFPRNADTSPEMLPFAPEVARILLLTTDRAVSSQELTKLAWRA